MCFLGEFDLTTYNSARRFYFAYCEAAFDAKYIHDYHILWVKDAAATTALASQPLPSSAALTSSPTQPITQVCFMQSTPMAHVRWTTAILLQYEPHCPLYRPLF